MSRILARRVGIVLAIGLVAFASRLILQAWTVPAVGEWAAIGEVTDARTGAASVTLLDGRTLITGGVVDGAATDSVVVYDPVANEFSSVGQLSEARTGHTATLLADGTVLIAGGTVNDLITSDIFIFDPAAGTSGPVITGMAEGRTGHAAARLGDDTVLIVGGSTVEGVVLQSAEIFDPATGSVTALASGLLQPRTGASATTLIDGRVLIAGGSDGAQDLASAEVYEGVSQAFEPATTELSVARSGHTAVLLPHNNSVLIAGGSSGGTPQSASDLFVPALFPDPYSYGMGTFAATGAMAAARSGAVGGSTSAEGHAFVAGGGSADAEVYGFSTIKTDKDDYAPGEPAIITGAGWLPGEAVKLVFQEDPAVHPDYVIDRDEDGNPLIVADANGQIYYDQWAPEEHDLGVRFYLMATGSESQSRAQTTFTDSISVTVTAPTFAWHRTGEVAGGFNVSVSGTYTCTTGGGINSCSSVTNLTITVGGVPGSKVVTGLAAAVTGAAWGPVTLEFRTVPGAGQFAIPATDGKYNVTATLTTNATNSPSDDTENNHFGVDNTSPETDIQCDGDNPCDNPYTEDVTVKLFPDDGNAATSSGVDSTLYCVDTANTCTPTTTWVNGPGFDVTYVSGATYYVRYLSTDEVGNVETTKSQAIIFASATVDATITTTIHDGAHGAVTSVALGTTVHDSVTVSGSNGTATGNVTFTFYSDSTCTTATATSGTFALSGGSVDATTFTQGPLAVGSYAFKASYAGDTAYNPGDGACEPLTVTQAQLTVTTVPHDASHTSILNSTTVPLGTVAHDTATLAGTVSGFTPPAITFTFYTSGNCTSGGSSIANAGAENGGVYSADTSALAAGSYSFKASVAGDANYLGDESDCEPFTVRKAQLTVNTVPHDASHTSILDSTTVPLGTAAHDTATLTGAVTGFTPPAITFTFYNDPAAGACVGTTTSPSASAGAGSDAGKTVSAATDPLGAGEYAYTAAVAGDANYEGDNSDCEPFIVAKAQLTVTTAVHDSSHTDKTNGSVVLASVMHDQAVLSGAVDGFSAPAITFTFYTNNSCTGGTAVSNTGADSTGVRSADTSALAAGSYSFKGSVAGNANYLGDNSDCEPFTVNAAPTTTTASVPTTTPQYSDKARLRAEVTPYEVSPFQLTGTVYFFIGTSAMNCTTVDVGDAVGTDVIADADNGVAEIEYQLTSQAGNYTLTACFDSGLNTNFTDSGDDATFTVNNENATFVDVAFTSSIPVSQTSFTVTAAVQELRLSGVEPDINAGAMPGDISLVTAVNAKITGVALPTSYNGTCNTFSGGSADYASKRTFTCTFSNGGNPFVVDAYTLTLDIPTGATGDQYWMATTYEDGLAVWDPNAGFATGGGTFLLDGDRTSFGFSYTMSRNKLRSGFVVVRHMAGGGVCRLKSTNQMLAPAVNGNTATLSGKGNYSCTDAFGNPITGQSQGNINIAAYAEDNGTSGIDVDKFWVSNAAAVTPNNLKMSGTGGAAANAVLLRGGNVQVPQPQKK